MNKKRWLGAAVLAALAAAAAKVVTRYKGAYAAPENDPDDAWERATRDHLNLARTESPAAVTGGGIFRARRSIRQQTSAL